MQPRIGDCPDFRRIVSAKRGVYCLPQGSWRRPFQDTRSPARSHCGDPSLDGVHCREIPSAVSYWILCVCRDESGKFQFESRRRPVEKRRFVTIDGNEATANIAHLCNEVMAIYPITPSVGHGRDARRLGGRRPEEHLRHRARTSSRCRARRGPPARCTARCRPGR